LLPHLVESRKVIEIDQEHPGLDLVAVDPKRKWRLILPLAGGFEDAIY
jgi:hypothetical protein